MAESVTEFGRQVHSEIRSGMTVKAGANLLWCAQYISLAAGSVVRKTITLDTINRHALACGFYGGIQLRRKTRGLVVLLVPKFRGR